MRHYKLLLLAILAGPTYAQTVRIEAEDMRLETLRAEALDSASGGRIISLKGPGFVGRAEENFPGADGRYDVLVGYHDENDGAAQLSVTVGGMSLDTWTLDERVAMSSQPNENNFRVRRVATQLRVARGDLIELDALQGNWDNASVDYIDFVPGSDDRSGVATVAKSGGDYATPAEAINDLASWCRNADDSPQSRNCLLTVGPGVYELDETLMVPSGFSIAGAGRELTILRSTDGVEPTLMLGDDRGIGNVLKDLSVENPVGDGAVATAIRVAVDADFDLMNLNVTAENAAAAVGIDASGDLSSGSFRDVDVLARATGDATGILVAAGTIERGAIGVFGGNGTSIGVRLVDTDGGSLSISGTSIRVDGNSLNEGVIAAAESGRTSIQDTRIEVRNGAVVNSGLTVSLGLQATVRDTEIRVRGSDGASNTGMSYRGFSSQDEVLLDGVDIDATDGNDNTALSLLSPTGRVRVKDSWLTSEDGDITNVGLGIDFGGGGITDVRGSTLVGSSAAFLFGGRGLDSEVRLSFTTLDGPFSVPTAEPPAIVCAAVVDGDGAFFAESCPP